MPRRIMSDANRALSQDLPAKNELRAALERGDQRMNSHLSHDHALAQGLLAEFGTRTGRAERALAEFLDDNFGIDIGADESQNAGERQRRRQSVHHEGMGLVESAF
jgi:predicted transcriptional regulator